MAKIIRMYIGGMIGGSGGATIIVGGLNAVFPWNIACVIIGTVLIWAGVKLFMNGATHTTVRQNKEST